MELLIPSPDNYNLPRYLKKNDSFFEDLIQWLTSELHTFCGRQWRPFYTKNGGSREPIKNLAFGPEQKKIYQNRVYFFAERGTGISDMPFHSMLKWLLGLEQAKNRQQPVLKLFQRIAIGEPRYSHIVFSKPSSNHTTS